MIITALITLILNVLGLLLVFNLPQLPQSVVDTLDSIVTYIVQGISVLRAFVGDGAMTVIATLFGLVVVANVAYGVYTLVFWVIRKIPMLNIRQ